MGLLVFHMCDPDYDAGLVCESALTLCESHTHAGKRFIATQVATSVAEQSSAASRATERPCLPLTSATPFHDGFFPLKPDQVWS